MDRAYGEVANEYTPEAFPRQGDSCPKCGKHPDDRIIHTTLYFECTCGCRLWNEEPIRVTDEERLNKRGARGKYNLVKSTRKPYTKPALHTVQCMRCGTDVTTQSSRPTGFLCDPCRIVAIRERKKKYKQQSAKLNPTTPDGATLGSAERNVEDT